MLWRWFLFWVLAPAAALAAAGPAEQPPEDFPGRQYIDSRGCVFLRLDAGGWEARLARDASPVCGYPPTLSARGLDGKPRLRALDPDAGKSRAQLTQEALTRAVIPNLRPGELTSDASAAEVLPDMGPEPHSAQPMDELKAALRAASAVRQQMSRDLQPNRRLCELLGYDHERLDAGLGHDPTRGYCGALPETDLSRLAFARPVGSALQPAPAPPPEPDKTAALKAGAQTDPPPRTVTPRGVAVLKTGAASAGAAAPQAGPRKPVAIPVAAPDAGDGMIPAGARYVQIGAFAEAALAKAAIEKARRLGYPVLRGKARDPGGAQVILAGPFGSREKIVRALDALRKAGFRDASAR